MPRQVTSQEILSEVGISGEHPVTASTLPATTAWPRLRESCAFREIRLDG
jgi:hypothetical protein